MAASGEFAGPVRLADLVALLEKQFPGIDASGLEEDESTHRVFGFVISSEFADKSPKERNDLFTQKIRRLLGPRGVSVGIVLPYAPGEEIPFK